MAWCATDLALAAARSAVVSIEANTTTPAERGQVLARPEHVLVTLLAAQDLAVVAHEGEGSRGSASRDQGCAATDYLQSCRRLSARGVLVRGKVGREEGLEVCLCCSCSLPLAWLRAHVRHGVRDKTCRAKGRRGVHIHTKAKRPQVRGMACRGAEAHLVRP